MPYRILTDGVIECDTAAEVQALSNRASSRSSSATMETVEKPRRGKRGRKGKPNPAVKKMWAAAKRKAKAEGIKVGEARRLLAKQK